MTVKVASGIADITGLQVTYAGGNSPTFTAPGATNRIDLLTIDSAGTLAITEGAAAASPTPPAYPAWKLPICEVYLKSTSTSIVSYNDGASAHGYIYADVRPVLQMAMVNPTTHALLSLTHSDTTAAAAAVGAIITGQTGPVWARLTIGSAGKILRSDGTNLVYGDVLYPASTTQYRVLYSSASNTLADDANLSWIPASGLSATVSDAFPATLTRTTTATNDAEPSLLIRRATSSDMADGFGVRIGTKVADATSGFLNFGSIGWIRDGADATSKFVLRLPAAGVVADRLTVDATGKLTVAAATVGSLTGYIKGTTGVLSQQTGVPWADITDPPGTYPATPHAILSATHSDTTDAAVTRGAIITGQGATAKWANLALGTVGKVPRSDGTDVVWSTVTYPASTTSTRVLYSTGTNALGDSANLTFDGTGLTTGTFTVNRASAANWIEMGDATSSQYAYIDLKGDTTYTDYGLRLMRGNAGANANDSLIHRGTGSLSITVTDAGYLSLLTTNAERVRIAAGGGITLYDNDITLGTTTGTKIATATNQKLGFFNATPVVQPTGDVATALSALGLVASPTIAGGTGSFLGMYVHTSGTTHTTGATCHTIIVELVGGGGGGGGAKGAAPGAGVGGGGGSGSYARKTFTVAPSTGYTYAVGAAGAAGSTAPGDGGAGGNTTFAVGATTVTAYGGSGGAAGSTGTSVIAYLGGAGGVLAVNGDVNSTGQPGGWGLRCSGTSGASGCGGPSAFGGGGNAINTAGTGNDGGPYGSGAGGALADSGTGKAGGAGAAGVVIVWEFS
jgi:hypothetical protein